MKRTEPENIREIFERVMAQSDLEQQLLERRAEMLWPRVVGPGIAALCGAVHSRRGVLTVEMASASMRQELSMVASRIVADLNARIGKNVITALRLVAPSNRQ